MLMLDHGTRLATKRKLFVQKGGKSPRLTMALPEAQMKLILKRAEAEKKSAAFIARRLIAEALA